jgi:hypothetical protein
MQAHANFSLSPERSLKGDGVCRKRSIADREAELAFAEQDPSLDVWLQNSAPHRGTDRDLLTREYGAQREVLIRDVHRSILDERDGRRLRRCRRLDPW